VRDGPLDLALMQEWIGGLLQTSGEDLFRMKGVLHVAHARERFVFHAVHMVVEHAFEDPWDDAEPRHSKLVFIGKNLDAAALAASFNACLATEDNMRRKKEALRFDVGDEVACNIGGDEWADGVVVAHNYRDEHMAPGQVAPYQIQLDEDGGLIWAPSDCGSVIRARARRSQRLQATRASADDAMDVDGAHAHTHGFMS
jgi:hypothetical protein